MQAKATDYYVGAEINSSWSIQGKMTDPEGDGTFSLIVNLPQQTGMYFTLFSTNSITWEKAFRPDNSSSPWITNSVYEINMLESNSNGYSIYYPIGYDDANKNFARAIQIDYTPSTTANKLKVTRLIVVGSGYNGWSTTTDYLQETACGSKIYKGKVTLEKTSANYDDGFKFNYFNYYNSNVNNDWGGNNNNKLSNSASNVTVSEDGVYELTANFNNWDWVNPVLAKETAIVSSVGYATFSSEYALDFTNVAGVTPYRATVTGDNKVLLTKVTGKVPAETGLLLVAENGASVEVPTTICTTSIGDNKLVATVEETPVAANDNNYMLANTNGVGFYYVASETTSGAGKAYLHTDNALANESGVNSRAAWIFADNEVSAINQVTTTARTNEMYDLQGRRVAQPTKGLYIVNGKKVMVK